MNQTTMKPFINSQELARRFNEDEAVWCRYEQKRKLRRVLGPRVPLPEKVLDNLDWLEAEQTCRERRYIGKLVVEASNQKRG